LKSFLQSAIVYCWLLMVCTVVCYNPCYR
jgi:hypothetical protein